MIENQRHFNREIAGIKPSQNSEAELLENILGIKFLVKPIKVFSTIRNRLAFCLNQDIKNYLGISLVGILRDQLPPGKALPPSYNAIVIQGTDKEDVSGTALHENMHCYMSQINPEIDLYRDQFMDNLDQYFRDNKHHKPELIIEKDEVFHCFEEGVAEWAAYEVVACQIGSKDDPAQRKEIHRKGVRRLPIEIEIQTIEPEYIEAQLQRLQKRINELEKRLPRGAEEFLEEYRKMVDDQEVHSLYYILGHYFVYEGMNNLTQSGMSISEALQTLIKNPPNTMSQLRNPKAWGQVLTTEIINQ